MQRLSISRAWEESKAIFARDGRLLVAVALALIVLPTIIVGLAAPTAQSEEAGALANGLQLVASLIAIVGQVALIRLAIGPATTVGGAIAHGGRRFLAAFGALLLMVLAFAVIVLPLLMGFAAAGIIESPTSGTPPTGTAALVILLVIVLVLALAVRFILTMPIASAERIGPVAIVKRSWNLSKGHYGRLLGLMVLLLVAALLLVLTATAIGGVLARILSPDLEPFSLGALILALFGGIAQGAFTILSSLMIARVYVQLAGTSDVEVSVPASNS